MDLPATLDAWGSPARAAGEPAPGRFSIKQQFAGATVFLTGATGYIGGLVLESMLRTTEVARVFVLLRGKKSQSAQQRCDKLLQGPTFHLVRDKPEILAKVVAVAGDLSEPGLGLSAADAEALAEQVDILIHSAADIRLEAPIQETVRANYVGTKRVVELALQLRRLRSMVHVSTAYVNINQPAHTTLHERIYPLSIGEVEVDGETIAEELLSLSERDANWRGQFYTRLWGFPNTYCLGKHLAEQMVYRVQKTTGLPIAILRPSLVTGVAGLPWPGYCGNYAGPSGMGAAVAIGFFPALTSHGIRPFSVWDAVPGDLVASAILATAAAAAAGLQRDIARTTGSGAWERGGPGGARGALSGPPAFVAPPLVGGGGLAKGGRDMSFVSAFTDDTALGLIAAGSTGGAGGSGPGSSSRSSGGDASDMSPTARSGASDDVVGDLGLHADQPAKGGGAAAAAAAKGAAKPAPVRAGGGAGAAPRVRPPQPLIIVHATTGTTYPATMFEAYNTAVDFLKATGSPVSILAGGMRWLPYMSATREPDMRLVRFWVMYNWIKVTAVCFLLRLFGLTKAAHKLSVGFQQWAMNNHPKNDTQLLFACAALRELHARIEPAERRDYLLTFEPPRQGARDEEELEHPQARIGWRQYSINCMAGIMRMLTGANVPNKVAVPGRPGEFIEHQYMHIR